MAVNPGGDFSAYGTAFTSAVVATATAGTRRTIQEVLLQSIAHIASKLWTRAAEHAIAVVAGISVVALGIATHDCFALHISRRALPTSTAQPIAAVRAILLVLVFRAVRAASGTCLLGIALANASAADGVGRGKLAVSAAVLVGIIADGVVLESTSVGVTARILATASRTTAIALLVTFYDAVSAGLASDGSNVPVVSETG